jgi:hypothetical protein
MCKMNNRARQQRNALRCALCPTTLLAGYSSKVAKTTLSIYSPAGLVVGQLGVPLVDAQVALLPVLAHHAAAALLLHPALQRLGLAVGVVVAALLGGAAEAGDGLVGRGHGGLRPGRGGALGGGTLAGLRLGVVGG